ncbi:MAG: glycosyltransferase, partial [Chryseolinea sp.]
LGQGELKDQLSDLIATNGLVDRVIMPGHVENVMELLSIADFLIHPSLLDSSSVTVKEAGLAGLPVIVCEGIGDFDSYIVNEKNGFLVNPNSFVNDAFELIAKYKDDKVKLEQMSSNLREVILDQFQIENTIKGWQKLILPFSL